jgi:N-acyltransferase N-terminal domain
MPDIRDALDDDADTLRLVEQFGPDGRPDVRVDLPSAQDLPAALLGLAVPHEDIDPLVSLLPRMSGPREAWLLGLCVGSIDDAMGSTDGMLALPRLRETEDPLSRYFYVFVYQAARSRVERFHAEHGVDPSITSITLTDLGRNTAVYRLRHPASAGSTSITG